MQNKGIVKFITLLLVLVCIFYLSFSFVTRHYENKAAAMGEEAGQEYLDSIMNEKVYLGIYSLKQCREMEIGLGLDLKGGMNVVLEVSVPDVISVLADHKTDPAFVKSMNEAKQEEETSQDDFISLFVKSYHKNAPGHRLAEIFATQQMKGKVSTQSTDAEVERALRAEVQSAVDNSFNVVRNRIDKFGVVQPNIQKLEGQTGRIMVEMPGIKEPERVRKLLQGSANLEFWETYNSQEIVPSLAQLNQRLQLSTAHRPLQHPPTRQRPTLRQLRPGRTRARSQQRWPPRALPRRPAARTPTPRPSRYAGKTRSSRCSSLCRATPSAWWDMPLRATRPTSTR